MYGVEICRICLGPLGSSKLLCLEMSLFFFFVSYKSVKVSFCSLNVSPNAERLVSVVKAINVILE